MLVLLAERADTRNYTGERLPWIIQAIGFCPIRLGSVHSGSRG